MLKELMNNPYIWIILSSCTVISFLYAFYVRHVDKKKKEISYISNSYKVIEGGQCSIPALELKYKDRTIENLAITKYAIWNSGNDLINNVDIVNDKPLQIFTTDKENSIILDANIILENEETNKFDIAEITEEFIKLKFDYIEPKNGIILQIIHSGISANLSLDCKIKGGKSIKKLKKRKNNKVDVKKGRKVITVLLISEIIWMIWMSILYLGTAWRIIPWNIFEFIMIFDQKSFTGIIGKLLSCMMFGMTGLMIHLFVIRMKYTYYMSIPIEFREDIE